MHFVALSSHRWMTLYALTISLPATAATAPAPPAGRPAAAAPAGQAPRGAGAAVPAAPAAPPVTAPVIPPASAPSTGPPEHQPTAAAQAPGSAVRPPGDTLPAGRPITLDDALAIAYRNHADVIIAEQSLEIASQRVTEAKAGTRPNINGTLDFTERGSTDFGGLFGRPTGSPNLSDSVAAPQVAARYTVFDQGQTRLSVRQAKASVRSASEGVLNAHVSLGFLVTNAYFTLLRNLKLQAVSEEQVRLAQQQLDLVEARIAAGTAARSDRAQIATSLALARQRLIAAQNDVRQAGSALRNTMGLPAGPMPNLADAPPPDYTIPGTEESLAEAFRRRPDFRQDQASLEIAEAGLELARIRRLPVLTTSAGFNITPTARQSRGDWSLFTGVSMPIWDSGVTKARQEEASATLATASTRLEQDRKDIAADVEQALFNLSSAKEQIAASQASVDAATVALQAANARFEVGLAIPVEITSAQLDYITALSNQVTSLYAFYIARAQFDRAIGRYRGASGG